MIAIAVAVTAITAGAAVAALTPGLTLLGGISTFAAGSASLGTMVAAGAIGGALGSIASQGFGVAIGQQSKFDWKGVAMGALSGAISAGVAKFGALAQVGKLGNKLGALSRIGNLLHGGGFLGGAARGLVGSALSQGIGVATGLQDKFDFAGVAGAALAGGVTGALGGDVPSLAGHVSLEGIAANASLSAVGAFANAAARTLINGSDFGDNLIAALPDVIGSTIGNLIAGGVQEGRSVDLADANGPIYPGGDSYDGDGMMEEWEDNNHVGATAYQGDGIVEAWESAGSPPELTDSGLSHQVDILGDEKAYQLGAADLDPNIEFALAHGFIGAAAQRVPGEEDGIPRFSVREMFENLFRHAETSRQTVVDRVRDFIPDLTCRSLTSGEIQMARPVFGPVIDYSVVEVCRGNATNPAAAAAFFKGNPAITIGNRIYVRSSTRFNRYVDDYSHAIPEFQSLFIHEMTHVFQYRMLGGVAAFSLRYSAELAMVRGHPDRMYEYQQGVTPFGSAMLEAQAQMVGDRWRAVVEHDTAAIRRLDRNLETAPWPIMNTRRW
jgi:hypothetical protein